MVMIRSTLSIALQLCLLSVTVLAGPAAAPSRPPGADADDPCRFLLLPVPAGYTLVGAEPSHWVNPGEESSIFASEVDTPFTGDITWYAPVGPDSHGMLLLKREKVTVDGKRGGLFTVRERVRNRYFTRLILIVADGQGSASAVAIFPEGKNRLAETLRRHLLALRWGGTDCPQRQPAMVARAR